MVLSQVDESKAGPKIAGAPARINVAAGDIRKRDTVMGSEGFAHANAAQDAHAGKYGAGTLLHMTAANTAIVRHDLAIDALHDILRRLPESELVLLAAQDGLNKQAASEIAEELRRRKADND